MGRHRRRLRSTWKLQVSIKTSFLRTSGEAASWLAFLSAPSLSLLLPPLLRLCVASMMQKAAASSAQKVREGRQADKGEG